MADFASTLKKIRLERGMSLEEFATFLGTSKQNLSRYECGEVTPKISTAAKMARMLGITLGQLNGDEEQRKTAPVSEQERSTVIELFSRLTNENQAKLIDYAQLLLTAQEGAHDSQD